MRIGLVSYRCENKNTVFNLSQIERAMRESAGKLDLLCFGEAFLQGFDALCWNYEIDKEIAITLQSETMLQLRKWTEQYGLALLSGYIEKEQENIYSSCVVLSNGKVLHNYRRISRGWKDYWSTDDHYREGTEVRSFLLHDTKMTIALCGDLWDHPERFKTDGLLIWPVYVNFTPEEWEQGDLEDYAKQAALAATDILMINSLDREPKNYGGSFHFRNGETIQKLPFEQEQILVVDI